MDGVIIVLLIFNIVMTSTIARYLSKLLKELGDIMQREDL